MKAILAISAILISCCFQRSIAQTGIDSSPVRISLSTLEQPAGNMASQLKQIAHAGTQPQSSFPANIRTGIEWKGYDHHATLGFFCKFEDLISTKSRFQFNLGLTGD